MSSSMVCWRSFSFWLKVEDEMVAVGFGFWLEVEYEFFHGVLEEF